MASREREALEEISNGRTTWAPKDTSEAARESFDKVEATESMEVLDRLIAADFIGDYTTHEESHSGKRRLDRILITKGLTFKGQDKSQWPD
jgi:hypothetical protein